MVSEKDDTTTVFCYGTSTHYIEGEEIWTVVGNYEFKLKKLNGEWKITYMRFDFKYHDGDLGLPNKARARLAKRQ